MHMRRSDASASVSVERFFEFALLGLVSSGFLAVASSRYLDAPTIALVAAALLLRALTIWGVVPLKLGERALTIAAALYAGFFLLDFFLISRDLLGATVHLAFFLVSLKVLSSRSERDHVYVAAIAVLELLIVDEATERLVLARAEARDIQAAAGLRTMLEDGLEKAIAGLTTLDEVLRVTRES